MINVSEQVNKYILSPPILNTIGNPYMTSSLPTETPESQRGLTVCGWVTLSYFRRPSVLFSLKDDDAKTWEISLGKKSSQD